jgi:hypothetical protein
MSRICRVNQKVHNSCCVHVALTRAANVRQFEAGLGRVLIKASAEAMGDVRFSSKSGHASALGLMSAKCQ